MAWSGGQSIRLEAPRPKAALRTPELGALVPEAGGCAPSVAICRATGLFNPAALRRGRDCWEVIYKGQRRLAEAITATYWV